LDGDLTKPIRPQELDQIVEEYVSRRLVRSKLPGSTSLKRQLR
jgi:hypothetical protein